MVGMRYLVVLCGSTKTSLPTAMDSIWVEGWYAATFFSIQVDVKDLLLAAAKRSSLGRSTMTLIPVPDKALRTAGSESNTLTRSRP